MNAITISAHGDRDVLTYTTDFPTPKPGPGEVLVKVAATGLNQVDLVIRRGYPGIVIPFPHVPGADIAGTVVEVGVGADEDLLGKRIIAYPLVACWQCQLCKAGKPNLCLNWKYFGLHLHGGYAEYVCIPSYNAIQIHDVISWEQAVSLPVAGLTAYHGLERVGELKRGQTFFIWGGTGAMGSMAIQIAKVIGATVIATGSTPEKLEVMKSLGADYVFNRKTDDVQAEVMKLFPAGVDLIMDYVGPETFPKSFQMVKKGGTILLCGIITGREVSPFSLHMTYLRHISVKGLYLGNTLELAMLNIWVSTGQIKPLIHDVLPLSEAREAHRRLEAGEMIGKIVLRI